MGEQSGIDPYIDLYFEDLFQHAGGAPPTESFVTTVNRQARSRLESIEGVVITDEVSLPPRQGVPPPIGTMPETLSKVTIEASPAAREALTRAPEIHSIEATRRRDSLPVLVQLRRADWDRDIPGLVKFSRLGRVLTARATYNAINALKADSDVISVEASRGGGVMECATSMPWIRAEIAHTRPPAEKGGNAIFALIDAGLDVLHLAFQANGRSRILYLWDQSDSSGPTPRAFNSALFTQDYGTLHVTADIDGYIAVGAVGKNLKRDPLGHGTHVASIAAGSPVANTPFPGGVAPEADIIVVIPKLGANAADPQSLGYSMTHVDGLAFLRAAADHEKKPMAVNVSLGMNAGAHDGSSILELAFDSFTNGGRDPGSAIVKSAGNEFGFGGHANLQVFQGGVVPIRWRTNSQARVKDYLEFWHASSDDLELTLAVPGGGSCTVDRRTTRASVSGPGFTAYLDLARFYVDNGDTRITVVVRDNNGGSIRVAGEWELRLHGRSVFSDGTVHAWVERDDGRAVEFLTGSANSLTLSIPGTAHSVITVGACEPHDPLFLSDSSSRGPTRDGRPKPELVAPGVQIVAAEAGTFDGLVAMTGTSMAAPHVTGAVALLLSSRVASRKPQLNAVQIRAALIQGVRGFNGRWQDGFGHGRLDVIELLDAFG